MFLEVSLYEHLANNVWQAIFGNINVIKQHTAEWSSILFFFSLNKVYVHYRQQGKKIRGKKKEAG